MKKTSLRPQPGETAEQVVDRVVAAVRAAPPLVDGVYQQEGATSPLHRYTAFVIYPLDPAALALDDDGLAQLTRNDLASVEEIDVDADSESNARAVAQAALETNYEPGGRIVHLEERVGWYW